MSTNNLLAKGVFWSAIEKYSGVFLSLIISSVLARLISPSEFGVVSVATVIIAFFNLFTDLGIGSAIIQHRDLTDSNLNSIFTYTLMGGIVITLLFFFCSWPIAHYYKDKSLISVCQLLSINLLFSALNIVPRSTMAKALQFKLIAKRTLILQVITGTISIIVALRGGGIYTLLISPILTSIGIFLYNFKYFPRKIDWSMDITPMKKIFSYSTYQFLFGFVNYFSRNIDNLLIGKYLNLSDLGYYDKSYRLMLLPVQNITNVVTPVMQPIFSKLQHDKNALAENFKPILKILSTIGFPLGVFLYFTAKELITVVYGHNWDAAIPLFRILALSIPLQLLGSTFGAMYQSSNATKILFYNGMINSTLTVCGFIIAMYCFDSVVAVAWSFSISCVVGIFVNFILLFKAVLKQRLGKIFKIFVNPIVNSGLLVGLFFLVEKTLDLENIWVSLLCKISILFVFSLLYIQVSKRYDLIEFLKKFRHRFKSVRG